MSLPVPHPLKEYHLNVFSSQIGAAPVAGYTAVTKKGRIVGIKAVLQSIWQAGGKPDVIMTGGFNKQVFSTFTGRASPIEDTKAKKITASVDAYESDFGTLKVVANRFSRPRDVLVLQMDMWAVAYLNGRKMVSMPLAKTGDSEKKEILSEYALEARNEKASGGVFDNTTV